MATPFSFDATLWEHDGPGAWHFVSLPADLADEIAETGERQRRGFGAVRVEVTIGISRWRTSLFPDMQRGTYLLPIKKGVRTAEALAAGSHATVHVIVLEPATE